MNVRGRALIAFLILAGCALAAADAEAANPVAGMHRPHAKRVPAPAVVPDGPAQPESAPVPAAGDDGSIAVSAPPIASPAPTAPPRIPRGRADRARDLMLDLGVAVIVALVLARPGRRWRWLNLGLLALPVAAAVSLALVLVRLRELDEHAVSLARGILAAVVAVAVAREAWAPPRFPADRRFVLGALVAGGLLSGLAFYNLGQPQFLDQGRGQATFVHHLDLRQYYPTAKYFRELGYRGIYEADLAAYMEMTGTPPEVLADRPVRDLAGDYSTVTVRDLKDAIKARRARFSEARWDSYKRDVQFFRDAMGDEVWLDTLQDFGGNATPVWMTILQLLWRGPPSHQRFAITGALDLILFIVGFACIGRAFGARTMFVSMVVFGANDFIMYGTNWAGATLRHDWLMYLAMAACALKLRRPLLGGALIGAAAMIRAFPILAIAGAAMPVAWTVLAHVKEHRRLPGPRTLLAIHRETARVFLGAGVVMLVLFLISSAAVGVQAWPEWYAKAGQLSALAHPADISFRSFVGGWVEQPAALRGRLPFVLLAGGLLVALAFAASWRARPERAMLLGLALVPVLLNPANYYSHLVFLLVLLGDDREGAVARPPVAPVVWLVLLLMCVAQFFTELVPDRPLHFYFNSAILMATLAAVLFVVARQRALEAGLLGPAPDEQMRRA